MQHDRGDRTAHAERRRGDALAGAQAGHGPQSAAFRDKMRRFEMFGDAVDAVPIADQDRRFADLVFAATDVPRASRHEFNPRSDSRRAASKALTLATPVRTASAAVFPPQT